MSPGLPTFFVLGAAKCTTTTLHKVLSQHPEIKMFRIKEPSFFSRKLQVVSDPITYFSLFNRAKGKRRDSHRGIISRVPPQPRFSNGYSLAVSRCEVYRHIEKPCFSFLFFIQPYASIWFEGDSLFRDLTDM